MPNEVEVELDEEQSVAAGIDEDVRQIVIAPPGSGKTEVVAGLLDHLVNDRELGASDELLVISFSRAAVTALRRRARGREGLGGLGVRTLDALASQLLAELDEEPWEQLSFDARISRALALVKEADSIDEFFALRHVVVDEVQDLVGSRSELVLEILRRLPEEAGFTLLGDPRQAVYNFQLAAGGGLTSTEFLKQARNLGVVRDVVLHGQHRARSKEAKAAIALGTDVGSGLDWLKQVRTFAAGLFMAGDVATLASPIRRWSGTTALLCRTNGEVLTLAEALRDAGLPITVRSAADELPVARWIGDALSEVDSRTLKQSDAEVLLANAPLQQGQAWRLLKSVERDFRASQRLDIGRLASGLARGGLPIDLTADDAQVVASTIHRAKGLEFDNVVIVNASDLLPGDAVDDEASVAYVALTRARDRLMTAKCGRPNFLRTDQPSGRWIIGGPKSWMTSAFEVRGSDTRGTQFTPDVDSDLPMPGNEVRAIANPRLSSLEVPVYDLIADGRTVARTNLAFGEQLARRLRGPRRQGKPWPDLFQLAVEAIETTVDPLATAGRSPIGLGVRVSGLGRLDWGSKA